MNSTTATSNCLLKTFFLDFIKNIFCSMINLIAGVFWLCEGIEIRLLLGAKRMDLWGLILLHLIIWNSFNNEKVFIGLWDKKTLWIFVSFIFKWVKLNLIGAIEKYYLTLF